MSEQNYAIWPVDPRFRRCYRQEEIAGYFYLVPAVKLGRGQIETANKARKIVALEILKDKKLLNGIRESRRQDLERSLEATKAMLAEADDLEVKDSLVKMQVLLRSTVIPDDDEATEIDVKYYVDTHRTEDAIYSAWIGGLYIPLADAPSIKDIWDFIPQYLLEETADFFAESRSAPAEKSDATTAPSTE